MLKLKTTQFGLTDILAITRQTKIYEPHTWRVEAWDGKGKSGYVRLLGVTRRGTVLIWRKAVRSVQECNATYMALNHYLLSRSDNQGINHIDNEAETVEITDAQLAQLEEA